MTAHNNKNSFKEVVGIFKKGYNVPAKTFVWAKTLNEWGKVGVGAFVLLGVASLVLVAVFYQSSQKQTIMNQVGQNLSSSLDDTVNFIDIGKRSLEKREELLKELMEATSLSSGQLTDQKVVVHKLNLLSALLESCRDARRTFVSALSDAKNPLLNPDISDSFKESITGGEGTLTFSREKPSLITLQEENESWGNLCWLCEQEIKRTQPLLQKVSN